MRIFSVENIILMFYCYDISFESINSMKHIHTIIKMICLKFTYHFFQLILLKLLLQFQLIIMRINDVFDFNKSVKYIL